MKRVLLAAALGLVVVGCDESSSTSAPAPVKPQAAPATMPAVPATTQASASASASAATIANAKCPVSGDKIDPKGKTVTYQGKTIGFCCDDCIDSFQKEPGKYAANLK